MDIGGERAEQDGGWPQRTLLLAGLGLIAGLIVHAILGTLSGSVGAGQAALFAFVTVAAGLFGFTLERRSWWTSFAFSLVGAIVAALVVYWNGAPDAWGASEGWRCVSLVLAIAVAAPLFQAARDEGAARFPYASVHDYAWSNVVLWCACCVFVGIVLALSWLLAMLFQLIDLSFLEDLLETDWFLRGLVGLAFGAGLGLLREHDGVVRLLQRVVATVLAVLAPVLGVGLLVFVLALPFTGLDALWQATRATTPILLVCVGGALVLANVVIGNMPAHERRAPALRWGAMALAVVMLPLGVLAAIATGLRIGQYGYTPERLWAVVFVSFACLYGAAYCVALVRGRRDWAARARPLNLALAMGVCGVALVLATPLVSFNAISTRDQLARLESGRVTPEQFDWRALAFDFGAPGRAALKRLQGSANATIRTQASDAAKAERRWEVEDMSRRAENRRNLAANLRVLPPGARLPTALRDQMAKDFVCTAPRSRCTLLLLSAGEAMVLDGQCFVRARTDPRASAGDCGGTRYVFAGGTWKRAPDVSGAKADEGLAAAYAAGRIEVRTVPRRQLFVGDVPVGDPFE